jgi:HAD superfamily hydrolase (TIGR01450 family)
MTPLAEGSAQALIQLYDAALLDLDGVVYIGPNPVPHAAAALATARRAGMRLAFVTNNAARTPLAVAEQLTGLGVPAEAAEVATSAQAAARVLTELLPAGSAVLVVGGEGLEAALRDRGLRPVYSLDDDPAAVVQGFHPTVGWRQLAEGTFAVRRGLPWVASNTDLTIPTHRGIGPGNGTLVEVIRLATGASPIIAGKPELALHRESAERVGAQRPLVVGDRLDTDIQGAVRADTDSLLVLTGVTDPAQLLAAPPDRRPTYLAEDLRGLLVAHPPVQVNGDVVQLEGWRATVRAKRLELSGSGRRVDGLRVACVAAWSATDDVDTGTAATRLATAD